MKDTIQIHAILQLSVARAVACASAPDAEHGRWIMAYRASYPPFVQIETLDSSIFRRQQGLREDEVLLVPSIVSLRPLMGLNFITGARSSIGRTRTLKTFCATIGGFGWSVELIIDAVLRVL